MSDGQDLPQSGNEAPPTMLTTYEKIDSEFAMVKFFIEAHPEADVPELIERLRVQMVIYVREAVYEFSERMGLNRCVHCGTDVSCDTKATTCATCRAERAARESASAWQPIETLPDDLKFFIAAWECLGTETGYDFGEVYREEGGFCTLCGYLAEPPKLWRPMPDGPVRP